MIKEKVHGIPIRPVGALELLDRVQKQLLVERRTSAMRKSQKINKEQCLRALKRVAGVSETMKDRRTLGSEIRETLRTDVRKPVVERRWAVFRRTSRKNN